MNLWVNSERAGWPRLVLRVALCSARTSTLIVLRLVGDSDPNVSSPGVQYLLSILCWAIWLGHSTDWGEMGFPGVFEFALLLVPVSFLHSSILVLITCWKVLQNIEVLVRFVGSFSEDGSCRCSLEQWIFFHAVICFKTVALKSYGIRLLGTSKVRHFWLHDTLRQNLTFRLNKDVPLLFGHTVGCDTSWACLWDVNCDRNYKQQQQQQQQQQ